MEHRGSKDSGKKVHIKLKTDAVKQDPRSVKASPDKPILKKDDEYEIPSPSPSPETSRTSQNRSLDKSEKPTSDQNSSGGRKTTEPSKGGENDDKLNAKTSINTEDEAKKKRSKDEPEKLEKSGKSVLQSNAPPTDFDEAADKKKPSNSSGHENTPTTETNIGNDQGMARGSESHTTELKEKVDQTNVEEKSLRGTLSLNSHHDTSQSLQPATLSQDAKVSVENDTMLNKEKGSLSNIDKNGTKEGEISKPLSSIKEEEDLAVASGTLKTEMKTSNGKKENDKPMIDDENTNNNMKKSSLISTGEHNSNSRNADPDHDEIIKAGTNISSNRNDEIDKTKLAGNSGDGHEEANDSLNSNGTSKDENQDDNKIIEAKVSVHDDDDAARDTPSTKVTIKVRKKTNEDLDQGALGKKGENNEGTEEQMRINNDISSNSAKTKSNSDIRITTDSNSLMKASTTESTEVRDGSSDIADGPTAAKESPTQGLETHSAVENGDKNGDKQHQDENSVEGTNNFGNNGKNDSDKRNDDDLPISLGRTTGSEDLKINELKKRVRPGQVFIVKGDPDCYSVRWAQKRKVLAYKVGSKNTSRFSTVLIETVEQLERASEKRPCILSEFAHPTAEAKGSLLSTYFAGANERRIIRDNLVTDTGTNTDQQNESDATQKSPEYINVWAKEHISTEKEAFGGVTPNQPTTADPTIQSNNYNYPFLTDYDVNHERTSNK